jgi:hypothetical protein
MVTVSLLLSLLALCVSGWALWFAITGALSASASHRAIAEALQFAEDQQVSKETALHLLDEVMLKRTEEVKTCTAKIQALQQKYETTLKLYQESVAIDGPLGSKRVQ